MSTIYTFMKSHGVPFQIERSGSIVATLDGLPNKEQTTGKPFIGFYPDSDVQTGDWLINPAQERFHVISTETSYLKKQAFQLKAYYQTDSEYQKHYSNVFNIGTAYGSVIGTQANVTLNYNEAIESTKKLLAESDSPDKEELQQIISLLEMVVKEQVPVRKGLFSRFSAVMERNSWLTSSIASTLLSWLMTQIP